MSQNTLKLIFLIIFICLISACQSTADSTSTATFIPATAKETATLWAPTVTSITPDSPPSQIETKETATSVTSSPAPLATATPTVSTILQTTNTPIPSVTSTAIPQVLVVFNAVNLRRGPGIDYPIISFIYENDIAEVLGVHGGNRGWYNIRLIDGRLGWVGIPVVDSVNTFDIELIPTAATIPASVTPTPTNTPTATFTPLPPPPKPTRPKPTVIPPPTATTNPYP